MWLLRAARGGSGGAAAKIAIAGNIALALALMWPAGETRVAARVSKLDEIAPVYQFVERHEIDIPADAAAVDKAIRNVTAQEIRLYQTLTSIRRWFGSPAGANVLNAPSAKPILETALQGGFALISDEPGREIVFGAAVIAPPTTPRPVTAATLLDQSAPGLARAIMNFRIEQIDPARCRLITETRVHATDSATARKFSWYWRLIYPGSWIIRWTWLNAIRDRAISGR